MFSQVTAKKVNPNGSVTITDADGNDAIVTKDHSDKLRTDPVYKERVVRIKRKGKFNGQTGKVMREPRAAQGQLLGATMPNSFLVRTAMPRREPLGALLSVSSRASNCWSRSPSSRKGVRKEYVLYISSCSGESLADGSMKLANVSVSSRSNTTRSTDQDQRLRALVLYASLRLG